MLALLDTRSRRCCATTPALATRIISIGSSSFPLRYFKATVATRSKPRLRENVHAGYRLLLLATLCGRAFNGAMEWPLWNAAHEVANRTNVRPKAAADIDVGFMLLEPSLLGRSPVDSIMLMFIVVAAVFLFMVITFNFMLSDY